MVVYSSALVAALAAAHAATTYASPLSWLDNADAIEAREPAGSHRPHHQGYKHTNHHPSHRHHPTRAADSDIFERSEEDSLEARSPIVQPPRPWNFPPKPRLPHPKSHFNSFEAVAKRDVDHVGRSLGDDTLEARAPMIQKFSPLLQGPGQPPAQHPHTHKRPPPSRLPYHMIARDSDYETRSANAEDVLAARSPMIQKFPTQLLGAPGQNHHNHQHKPLSPFRYKIARDVDYNARSEEEHALEARAPMKFDPFHIHKFPPGIMIARDAEELSTREPKGHHRSHGHGHGRHHHGHPGRHSRHSKKGHSKKGRKHGHHGGHGRHGAHHSKHPKRANEDVDLSVREDVDEILARAYEFEDLHARAEYGDDEVERREDEDDAHHSERSVEDWGMISEREVDGGLDALD